MFGFLIAQYRELKLQSTFEEESGMIQAIVNSLEKQWSKCDQEVFFAAVILNPVYKASPFAQLDTFTNSGIYGILSRLWTRFYCEEPPSTLLSELFDYIGNTGAYKSFPSFIASLKADMTGKVSLTHLSDMVAHF